MRREDVCGDTVSIIIHAVTPEHGVGDQVHAYLTDK